MNPDLPAWVEPDGVLLDVDLRDRAAALNCIAMTIAQTHGLEPAPVLRALERREQAASTGMGDGFAIPHARIGGLDRPLTLFVRSKTPIEFGSVDHRPVRDFLAILVPADGDKQDHLDLLAIVAKLFSDPVFRRDLDSAPDALNASAQFRAAIAQLAGPVLIGKMPGLGHRVGRP